MLITSDALTKLQNDIEGLLVNFSFEERRQAQVIEEGKVGLEGFWDDREEASRILRKIKEEKGELNGLASLQEEMEELLLVYELWRAGEAKDVEVEEVYARLTEHYYAFELKVMMVGAHDAAGAILDFHPGAGGVESQDWAAMLLRMYTLWAREKGYQIEVISHQVGEEAGIKSAMIKVEGKYAYGFLRGEAGVHRLVRLSPFDANHRRHTSFAAVRVYPAIENEIKIEINPSELAWETFRASGAGGQNVNKVETAVRVKHLPTNTVVTCQAHRSQIQNKKQALSLLKLKLYQEELEKKKLAKEAEKKTQKEIGFGSQIRSYVLHPYKSIKDKRTKYEEKKVEQVLDGQLDKFIKAYLIGQQRQV